MKRVAVIGTGFAGLSAAAYLARYGYEVHVYEKNEAPGGRARQFTTANGFTFDMGPSWYWMPDVFENFFNDFGASVKDFYSLQRLDPNFDMVLPGYEKLSIPDRYDQLKLLFESMEPGSGVALDRFMKEAAYKYEVGMRKLEEMPGLHVSELLDKELILGSFKLQIFSSFRKHVRSYFKHPYLIALMEFPVLFLGAMPQDTPALYSLMNYAGLKLGTWYPIGGFGKVIQAMYKVCTILGVTMHMGKEVECIDVENKKTKTISVDGEKQAFDAILASCDYYHAERLLPAQYRNYSDSYWSKKTFAPSCLIFYLGISTKLDALQHHTLFFDQDLEAHAIEIYKKPGWPSKPQFYVSCPSRTEAGVAPQGMENVFLLMPIATGLNDTEAIRERYFNEIMNRLEAYCDVPIRQHIVFKRSYCVKDFIIDYNAYKGNAYGLANTLLQTAILKPKMKNKKLSNFFYTGQLTVPGPGVPPTIISGKLSAQLIHQYLKS